MTGWHLPRQRHALLVAVVCFTVFGAAYTFVSIISAVLFERAGGNHGADEIRAMAQVWIFRDRLRLGIGLVGFAAVLHAFRLPVPEEGS